MKRSWVRLFCIALGLVLFPQLSPAPLIYRAGEGWVYEAVGATGKWQRTRAKDQLEVAQEAFDKKDYGLAMKAGNRVVRVWSQSDYAPQGQFLVGRCYELTHNDEKAFKVYQTLIEKYPKAVNYDEVLKRQYEIANRFLAGQWFKLWGYIPFFPSMEKTAEMYKKIIANGPYSEVAPQAQMNIGAANEKRRDYAQAVKAYSAAADRYHDRKAVAADALYKAGLAYNKQAKTAEYDQNVAGQAIATFTDFIGLYPNDKRVPEAQKIIDSLKTEQARGSLKIAQYYEKRRRPAGALIYYNEVVLKDPNSKYAEEAKQRIASIKKVPVEAAKPSAPAKTGDK